MVSFLSSCAEGLRTGPLLEYALFAAGAAFFIVLAGAVFQWRRIRRGAFLFFGFSGRVPWIFPVQLLGECMAFPLFVFSAVVLFSAFGTDEPRVDGDGLGGNANLHHIVFMYDVSPSMVVLKDAGPNRNITRNKRMQEVYQSVLERIATPRTRYSVVAFWNDAKVVVADTFDARITDNIFDSLPLAFVMKNPNGDQTALPLALEKVSMLAEKWPENSATLIVFSDGDVLPERGLSQLPAAYGRIWVFGVGDTERGSMIDDRISRQNRYHLGEFAARFGGVYMDVNALLPSSEMLQFASVENGRNGAFRFNLRQFSIYAFIGSALVLGLLTVLPLCGGTLWTRRAGRMAEQEVRS